MADVEASGKTIEEAVEHALAELGAAREDVSIEVLSEGRGGILGVGAGQARVRVRLLADGDAAEPPAGQAGDTGPDGESGYIEDEAEVAAQTLDTMLAIMGVTADVSIRDAETPGDGMGLVKAVLDIEGDDLGILIGRRGETLASLQYLLNLMMMRRYGERILFTVDVEGYRRRRERQLNTLARHMADQVKRTKRPVTLEPMPPNERRIIHIALAEDRYVTTESSGEGDDRKVSISPRR
ncbi:MAG: protein jag [Chloroflexota bacterium]|nr:protein jag [Chloroflexota bacterium]